VEVAKVTELDDDEGPTSMAWSRRVSDDEDRDAIASAGDGQQPAPVAF
jgi:hypothetical protein